MLLLPSLIAKVITTNRLTRLGSTPLEHSGANPFAANAPFGSSGLYLPSIWRRLRSAGPSLYQYLQLQRPIVLQVKSSQAAS